MRILCALLMMFLSNSAFSESKRAYSKLSEVLSTFIKHEDNAFRYSEISENTYILDSQVWPIENDPDIPSTTWRHKVSFFLPKDREYDTVLLYTGGGYNQDTEGKDQSFKDAVERLRYQEIADASNAIVVELAHTPNQNLLMGGKWRREDAFLAYTYKKVMSDPLKYAYLAGHLPMAKSIVKAMDLIQEVLEKKYKISNARFVLSGASKRAWSVWLAALEDNRVDAIIPIVIDILNVQKSILHICKTHKECPISMKDYKEEQLTDRIDTPEFADLMKIEDPFQYLGSDYDSKYKGRLSIPKYIINASGDDFFVPDSSQWYFQELPGDANYIRYLPNSMHYFLGNPISDRTQSFESLNKALPTYFSLFLKKSKLPTIKWSFAKDRIDVESSNVKKAVLWTAVNESAPDFRFLNQHDKFHTWKKWFLGFFTDKICDTCYVPTEVEVSGSQIKASLPPLKKGWRSSFVELHYGIANRDFIISTEVHIESAAGESKKDL